MTGKGPRHRGSQQRQGEARNLTTVWMDLHLFAQSIFTCFFEKHVSVTTVSRLRDPPTEANTVLQFAFDEVPIISPDIRFLMTENLLIFFLTA